MYDKSRNTNAYQYFDDNERPVVDYITGLFNLYQQTGQHVLTDFLTPRENIIFHNIVGNQAQIFEYGGYNNAERKRLVLCDWDTQFKKEDFKIALIEISYNKKWSYITHSQILGVLTHIGLELSTFGDIIQDTHDNFQFFVKLDLVDYFCQNIDRVGRSNVNPKVIPLKEVLTVSDDAIVEKKVSSSLRVDVVVAAISNYSRKKVSDIISQGDIKLNWHEIKKTNIIVKVGDVLSIRHFGRAKITDINTTKKNKYLLILKIFKTKKR